MALFTVSTVKVLIEIWLDICVEVMQHNGILWINWDVHVCVEMETH